MLGWLIPVLFGLCVADSAEQKQRARAYMSALREMTPDDRGRHLRWLKMTDPGRYLAVRDWLASQGLPWF